MVPQSGAPNPQAADPPSTNTRKAPSRHSAFGVRRTSAESTQRMLVRDLADRAFGGSATQLVMQALSSQKSSPDELAEIRRLLNKLEGGGK